MFNQNHSTNKSKAERVYDLFLENPEEVFSSKEVTNHFNILFEDIIQLEKVTMILNRLHNKNKLLRTNTQTTKGYIYSLKNKRELDKKYSRYLLPYEFQNKNKLLSLMLQNSFDILKQDESKEDIQIAKLVAFVMGDGHIKKRKDSILFFFKEKKDAEIFKNDFPQYGIKVIKRPYCYACIIHSVKLVKKLESLGAPIGNKVFQPFIIPNWIYHGFDEIKLAFLSVIYGNEGSKPVDNRWRIQFVLSKNKENIENLLVFLNQIRAMLNHFGISSSFIQLRKQKGRQFCGRFYIKGKVNLHKFYKLLEFSYASEKQKVLEDLILRNNSFRSATVQ
ncbi:hypothetical protein GOV06_02950 [Candidatus Woesearchaeota archaeon]|nr:hypothetical protein [Candidatus Woesearchaeota archaeon]